MHGAFQLAQSSWLHGQQKYYVDTCIKTLSQIGTERSISVVAVVVTCDYVTVLCFTAKERSIAIPTDLETQVSKLYSQSQMMARTTKAWRLSSSRPRAEGEQRKRERQSQYKIIIDGLQDIVQVLEDQLRPLVQAELSVLVDVLHRPELLFPPHTDARRKCESGGFICKCVRCVVTSALRDVMVVT